jgi:curved DNA-binding protein CbpA
MARNVIQDGQAMATLYDMLGVQENATADEIKRAYRKAAMRWHPDRNAGREDAARAAFQEIKDAYAILSDASQRQVYDAVFADQMRGWESTRQQAEREQAEREAAARAAAEAAYAEMVALAMRFAEEGYNRDVVFGVLIGHDCEVQQAAQIADSVLALHASRQAAVAPAASVAEESQEPATASATGHDHPHKAFANPIGTLWYQFLSGLRL